MSWRLVLLPLTPVYAALIRARAAAYRRGLVATTRLAVPVISVGNLSLGGSGKTPTVVALVRDLVRRGRHPAVLTRGYRRSGREAPLVLIGPEPGVGPESSGDEPLELAQRLPGVPIVVDPDRVRGGREALHQGADVLVLDDGFQHLRLARDLDLVVLDAQDPWGGGRLPPRGRLREPVAVLARASAVLVSKVGACDEPVLEEVKTRVGQIAPGVPVLAARMCPRAVRTPEGVRDPEVLRGRRMLAFAGIGRPEGFAGMLEEAGAEVVARRWFGDHHRYRPQDLAEVMDAARAHDATPVTTGKDAVKLLPQARVWVVEADMVPLGGSWDELWEVRPEVLAGAPAALADGTRP